MSQTSDTLESLVAFYESENRKILAFAEEVARENTKNRQQSQQLTQEPKKDQEQKKEEKPRGKDGRRVLDLSLKYVTREDAVRRMLTPVGSSRPPIINSFKPSKKK